MINRICLILSTFFGLGFFPGAPGTLGTLGAVGVVWLLHNVITGAEFFYPLITLAIVFLSFPIVSRASVVLNREDPPQVVIDELCGYMVTMLFIEPTPSHLALGFFLFRFFDIAKPFPVRKLEALPKGYGVVMDDVAAGVYSNLCLHVFVFLTVGFSS